MSISPSNLINKISSSNSEVIVSTLNSHIWTGDDLEDILEKYKDKDLFFVWWVNKEFLQWSKKRVKDSDITEKNYFFIDIDIRKSLYEKTDTIISQNDLIKQINDIKDILNSDKLFSQRSFVNCSGNGMHIFYIWKTQTIDENTYKIWVKSIYNKFSELFKDKITFPIDTSCCNIGKIVRLPWTINHKSDYKSLTVCEILHEQDIESELFNNIRLYADEESKSNIILKNIQTELSLSKKINPGSLMDQINDKPLIDFVLEYTWRTLASDNRNFVDDKNNWYKWCFMHETYPNVLILDWTPHIPNPNKLQWHTTFTFIRDVLCNWNTNEAFKMAIKRYPELKDSNKAWNIWNPFDYFVPYWTLLDGAIKERRALNINNVCKYGVKILDEYLGWILPSELVVIGAETWVGKSELAYTMALKNASNGKRVLLFELEWDINEIALRHTQKLINETSNNPISTISYRFNTNKNIYKIENEVISCMDDKIKNNLFIFNKLSIPSIWFIKELVEKIKDDIDIIIIDHLHYIYLDKDDELRQIGEIMRTLKTVTDIIKKPIVLISHLRKKDNKTKERNPEVSDLYGSSNIGKEATTVLLLSKISAVNTSTVWIELPIEELDKRYMWTKIIVAKSRVWLPKSSFWLIYDLVKKKYLDEFQSLIEDESWAKEEDKITMFDNMEC